MTVNELIAELKKRHKGVPEDIGDWEIVTDDGGTLYTIEAMKFNGDSRDVELIGEEEWPFRSKALCEEIRKRRNFEAP